jgi:hypothetical protein
MLEVMFEAPRNRHLRDVRITKPMLRRELAGGGILTSALKKAS